jgi:glycosyltransferase involved in cell wall biosynthesis
MKIGIDASRYRHSGSTGVENYSVKIINGIIERFKHGKEHEIILYTPEKLQLYKTKTIKHRVIPFKRLWTKVRLSWEMLTAKPDVLFVPSHVLPYFSPKKAVITIHDVAFMHLKKAYSPFQFWYLKNTTNYAVKKASDIIVPSDATKNDLKHFFNCPEDKIHVIPHGCDFEPKDLHHDLESKVFQSLNLKRKDNYLLYIGRLEEKKNLSRLIKAFMDFSKTFSNYKLILAGKRGSGFKKILKTAVGLKAFKKIHMPGYITENEKHVLYKYCSAFVFPSLYEGFGFPVLEAFKYKKPVIASNTSSLPEVAGDGAIYVDPHSINSITEALKGLITKPQIKERALEGQKHQLEKFKWSDSVEKTIQVLLSKN